MANVIPPEQRPQAVRALAARQAIAQRFLAAAQQAAVPAYEGPLGLPAFLSLRTIRTQHDGSLNFTLNVPAEHVPDIYLHLTTLCGQPLAVTLEPIDISSIEPYDA